MSSNDTYTEAEWFWLSNLNPDGSDEEPEWTSYSQEESKLIEKAYLRQKSHVYLKYYCIDFELNEQRRINNPSRRRPVKRVEHDKGNWIKRIKRLGAGSFGTVYQGVYRENQEVAYKVVKKQLSVDAQREANILKTLRHPNIVQYIDVIQTANHTLLVMELIDGDTLWAYIADMPSSRHYWCTIRDRLTDVAYAMSYLHEKKVIHADLKSDNILLRRKGSAVLSDFGLSKVIQESGSCHEDNSRGAIRWRAPELCCARTEKCSFESDVWAFGCVLVETATKAVPWDEFSSSQKILDALINEENIPVFQEICRNLSVPDSLRKIIYACCTWFKENRPNFDRIIRDLRAISDRDVQNFDDQYHNSTGTHRKQPYGNKRNKIQDEPLYSDEDVTDYYA